jgi:hypothetical protein
MSAKTMRIISIALIIIALIWTILSLRGVSGLPPSYLRTILLVVAIVFLIMARRRG